MINSLENGDFVISIRSDGKKAAFRIIQMYNEEIAAIESFKGDDGTFYYFDNVSLYQLDDCNTTNFKNNALQFFYSLIKLVPNLYLKNERKWKLAMRQYKNNPKPKVNIF